MSCRAYPICQDTRPCFGRIKMAGVRKCKILEKAYKEDGKCAFAKADMEVTEGVRYPYDPEWYKAKMAGRA